MNIQPTKGVGRLVTVRNDAVSGGQVVDAEGRKGFWSFVKRMLIRDCDPCPQWTKAGICAEKYGPSERPWSDAWQVSSSLFPRAQGMR